MIINKKVMIMCSLAALPINGQDASYKQTRSLQSTQDIVAVFPQTVAEINTRVKDALVQAQNDLNTLLALDDNKRTFANTAKPFDMLTANSPLIILYNVLETLNMVSPDEAIRQAARDAAQKLQEFQLDALMYNKQLYHAFKTYADGNALSEQLSEQERYFIQETVQDFVRNGMNLPDVTRAEVVKLEKELAQLSQDFDTNIAADASTITVAQADLAGVDKDFIASLARTQNGELVLGVDYPTYFNVMENCAVEQTRKRLYRAFGNRAYPANDALLKAIIAKRHQLAVLLGFADYAHLNLDSSMAKTPETAQKFLDEIIKNATPKMQHEVSLLMQELPEGVSLTDDGRLYPWSTAYLQACYKKKHLALDEREIAEYFPMGNTIEQLLDIYRQFLNLEFKEVSIAGLWHEDVRRIDVLTVEGQQLGTLLLDLHPRPHKYSHACHIGIIPATYDEQGNFSSKLSLVIANFPKATESAPSLLSRSDVITFFHEFGHALHSILGRTALASFSGTAVKRDFVELPSQMLEKWLWDAQILKKVSRHFKTGQPLPDELIAKIQKIQYFNAGQVANRTALLSKAALAYFSVGENKDPYTIMQDLWHMYLPHLYSDPQERMYASFGHLTGYGARYYGYLWAQVFAMDLFSEIKKHGLLNPDIGNRYIAHILSKGGSQDPAILVKNFLGREPNTQAFFAAFGM